MALFAPSPPAPILPPEECRPPTKAMREAEKKARRENVDRYLAACATTSAAICDPANLADFLFYRAHIIADCCQRTLPSAAVVTVREAVPGLSASLAEGLQRVPWLQIAPWLRAHLLRDDPPVELQPLERLVLAALDSLRTTWGYLLQPRGSEGLIRQQPLDSACWPSLRTEQRLTHYYYEGMRWDAPEVVSQQHPIHAFFQAAMKAAEWIDARDIREAKEGK